MTSSAAPTPGSESVFDLFASVFQMRPALVLPALPFECDVSGCPTDHLLNRALQPLSLVPGLIGAAHGQSSSVVVSHGDYPISGADNPPGRLMLRAATKFARAQVAVCRWFNPGKRSNDRAVFAGKCKPHMNPSCEQDLNPANRPQGVCVHSQGAGGVAWSTLGLAAGTARAAPPPAPMYRHQWCPGDQWDPGWGPYQNWNNCRDWDDDYHGGPAGYHWCPGQWWDPGWGANWDWGRCHDDHWYDGEYRDQGHWHNGPWDPNWH
jgi:hypothetical protein